MRRRSIGFAMIVWATLSTTVLASFPHVDCVCPNGSKKLFCLSTVFGKGDCSRPSESAPDLSVKQQDRECCCCRRAAKSSSSGVVEKPLPTNAQTNTAPVRGKRNEASVERRGCRKSVAAKYVYLSERSHETLTAPNEFFWAAAPGAAVLHDVVASTLEFSAQVLPLPPPPDLVLIHCCILI